LTLAHAHKIPTENVQDKKASNNREEEYDILNLVFNLKNEIKIKFSGQFVVQSIIIVLLCVLLTL